MVQVPLDAEGIAYRRIIWGLALGITLFASLQVGWALTLGARQFLKDGLDWGFDIALYGLAAVTFGWGSRVERRSALAAAAVLGGAGAQTLLDLWNKVLEPRPIDLELLGFSAVSAVVIGFLAAGLLWRFRTSSNPLVQATWLSARNDAITTTLFATLTFALRAAPLRWPEYALDGLSAGLNFQAALLIVWKTATADRTSRETLESAPPARPA